MTDDPAAVAEAIVRHAETLCEHEDTLWELVEQLQIPEELLIDGRQQSQVEYATTPMVKAFLYQYIRGWDQQKLTKQLNTRTTIVKACEFDVSELGETPRNPTFSNAWEKFSEKTRETIKQSALAIRKLTLEHEIVRERFVPDLPSECDGSTSEQKPSSTGRDEHKRQKTQKTIRLARKHAFPEFSSQRAANRSYDDDEILDMFVRTCTHADGTANSEGEFGWLTADDLTASGDTILRVLKQFATPDGEMAQLTFDDIRNDRLSTIDQLSERLDGAYNRVIQNILNTIEDDNPFADRRTVAAIDITYERVWTHPWVDKANGIAKEEYPPMVSGYKKDGQYMRGYKFATLTLVGDSAPIILAVEPVKENSLWEDPDSPSYPKATIVERLLAKAVDVVDIDEVYLDRGFYGDSVFAAIDDRDIIYTMPSPKYRDEYESIKDIKEHPIADAAVQHNVPITPAGDVHHTAEQLYVPSRSEDADGKYAVFVTNRERVETDEIDPVCNGYRRRWEIENQYKSIAEFLPKTSSMDYRVRLTKFMLASLLYNLWRLTDYLIKAARDEAIRSPPTISLKVFLRAMGTFLREPD